MTTANRRTALVWDERFMWHNTGNYAGVLPYGGWLQPGEHAENPETKRRLKNLLDASGLTPRLELIAPEPASLDAIRAVHTASHIERVRASSAAGYGDAGFLSPVGHGSYEIALLAAGGALALCEGVVSGRLRNGYALIRPPGHHAEPDTAKGFCLFANAAIAGRYALDQLSLRRIAFVDWDVHHGNGTQAVFWEEPRALAISVHQTQCFPPDSGDVSEVGAGAGEGTSLNIELPPGSGAGAYEAAFDRVVLPALEAYRPDLIVVPSGFDAGAHDPLGRMMVHSECFRGLTKRLMAAADALCEGRLMMTHEGGYNAPSVPFLGMAVIEELAGIRTGVEDPFLPLFAGLGQQELQPHQSAMIDRAVAVVAHYAPRWRAL